MYIERIDIWILITSVFLSAVYLFAGVICYFLPEEMKNYSVPYSFFAFIGSWFTFWHALHDSGLISHIPELKGILVFAGGFIGPALFLFSYAINNPSKKSSPRRYFLFLFGIFGVLFYFSTLRDKNYAVQMYDLYNAGKIFSLGLIYNLVLLEIFIFILMSVSICIRTLVSKNAGGEAKINSLYCMFIILCTVAAISLSVAIRAIWGESRLAHLAPVSSILGLSLFFLLQRRIRVYVDRSKQIRQRNRIIESELDIARQLQMKVLPDKVSINSNLHVHAVFIPMDKVGGDMYGCFDRDVLTDFFVADVSGHGIPGAFLALSTKLSLDSIIRGEKPVSLILKELNSSILKYTVKSNYVTMFYCSIDRAGTVMRFCSAGHIPCFLMRKNGNTLIQLKPKGRALGMFDGTVYEEQEIRLEKGDRILLYTDGIIECMDAGGGLYGIERFARFIEANFLLGPEEFAKKLIYDLVEFSGTRNFEDDLTLYVIDRI